MTTQIVNEAIPMVLTCPACGKRHIDEGDFATKLHHTHACQHCGLTWRPAIVPTVGVQFLPGFKNEPSATLPEGVLCHVRNAGWRRDEQEQGSLRTGLAMMRIGWASAACYDTAEDLLLLTIEQTAVHMEVSIDLGRVENLVAMIRDRGGKGD